VTAGVYRFTHDIAPPGVAPPRRWRGISYCACCGRLKRRVVVYRGRTRCPRDFALALAHDWRRFRRDAGLPARGRLPERVVEEALNCAERAWEAERA
jgi:hypothetical protein